MYVQGIISNLGGWDKLQRNHPEELTEIQASIAGLTGVVEYRGQKNTISLPSLYKGFRHNISQFNWNQKVRLHLNHQNANRVLSEIDFEKNGVGVDLFFDRAAYLESYLFAKIPFFIRANYIKLPVLILPTRELEASLPSGVVKFSHIRELLTGFPILPLKYPFVIIGLAGNEPPTVEHFELNSALDAFLMSKMGKSLNEILVEGESEAYDFKEALPRNKKIAQEVCGFANREGGGLLLFGITDAGEVRGMPTSEWDEIQLRLSAIIASACMPSPEFNILRFPVPEQADKIIIVLEVKEIKLKPCMTNHRVYIRKSASVRPADSGDIRRMLIR
jgi:hypothetical protein